MQNSKNPTMAMSDDRGWQRKLQELDRQISGEVLTDTLNRWLYAVDASLFQVVPLAVARPRTAEDCRRLVCFAGETGIPLHFRAGGTSLAGQVVGKGIVVDVSRYLNRILAVNAAQGWAEVEAGVVLADLNASVAPLGLHFGPDPSTYDRCTIAGMAGNNAWGVHTPVYGTTRDNVLAMEVILSDGSIVELSDLTPEQLENKRHAPTLEGKIYDTLTGLLDRHGEQIRRRYPPRGAPPCNSGYAVDELLVGQPWHTTGLPLNLSRLICGSEGTLAVITKLKVRLQPLPEARIVVAVQFDDLIQVAAATQTCLDHGCAAAELLDRKILDLSRTQPAFARRYDWLQGEVQALLLVELFAPSESVAQERAGALVAALKNQGLGRAWTLLGGDQLMDAWALRRAGLGLLMGMAGPAKAVTFIEDSAVPVKHLETFLRRVATVMAGHGVDCVYYGSVAKGLVHLRPILDLFNPGDRHKAVAIAEAVADILAELGGVISAKHGDGRLRAHFIEKMLGREILDVLAEIKRLFDPACIFNPGKIIDPPPPLTETRVNPPLPRSAGALLYWPQPGGFWSALYQCNGAAVCRKTAGPGTMCPSYRVSKEERHSTRGRANVVRLAVTARGLRRGLVSPQVRDVMDLCLGCKGCQRECPAGVDMARMKSEHLAQYQRIHGVPLRTRAVQGFEWLAPWGARFPGLTNWVTRRAVTKFLLGVHPRRVLPQLSRQSLYQWFILRSPLPRGGEAGRVLWLGDTYTSFYDVSVAVAAIEVLESCGFEVVLMPPLPGLRAVISSGLIDAARARLRRWLRALASYEESVDAIVGVEPSELLTWRDDAVTVTTDESQRRRLEAIAAKVMLFEEFVLSDRARPVFEQRSWRPCEVPVLVHQHCHQQAIVGAGLCLEALRRVAGSAVQAIESGCCGMAGMFGFEKEHYEVSLAIGDLALLPAIRHRPAGAWIVATGASCRQQIRHATGVPALHPAQIYHRLLA